MVISNAVASKSNLDTSDYEPYIEDGEELGEVHWIRREFDANGEPRLLVGIMRADEGTLPEAFPYTWQTDETIQILEGKLVVEISGEETVTLLPGDVASFPQGKSATFKATAPYKQFFVMSRR
jgi:ethanolamine utilization protein EutQ (cupin superfamily)